MQFGSMGGAPVPGPAVPVRPSIVRFLPDGQSLVFSVVTGPADDQQIWRVSLTVGTSSRLTRLAGRRGALNDNFTTDGKSLYFVWREDEGDIWVMDVSR
jgi:Tol biopolymer transport system component